MAKDKEIAGLPSKTKPSRYKSGLSLNDKNKPIKIDLSFEQLVKKFITVEVKKKDKEEKGTSKED